MFRGGQKPLAFSREGYVWLLGSIANLFRFPFDERLVLNQSPPPHTLPVAIDALEAFGVSAQTRTVKRSSQLKRLPVPALAILRQCGGVAESAVGATRQSKLPVGRDLLSIVPSPVDEVLALEGDGPEQIQLTATPALIVAIDDKRIVYFAPGESQPKEVPVAEWSQHFEPVVWALKHNTPVPDQDHPAAQAGRVFGFRWFVPELLKHKTILRDVLIASAVLMLMGIGTPLLTQVIFDKVVVHETQSTLMVVTSALAILLVFNALMTWLRQYLVIHTGNRIDAVLGEKVFRHLLRLPMLYFQHRPTGTVMARLHGVETIREFLTGAAVTLLLDFPFMVILLVVMFFYSWELTLIALGILGALITASLIVMPAFRQSLNAQFLIGARNQAFVTEHVAGMETVKSLQMEPRLERRYGDYLADYLAANVRTKTIGNSYQVTTSTLEQLQVASILIVGAIIVMRHDGFTIGMLIAFQMFASRLAQPMMRLAGLYQEFQQAHIAVQRLGDLMNCPTEPYGLTPTRHSETHGHIEIRGLGFRYSDKDPYLYRSLNVSFPPGKTVAIMGPSGSGKSTLAKLLQGFVQPSEGSVRLDGIDIANLSANELRSQLGVVPQETILFSGTLYDNLLAATPAASFDDIVASCKAAGIHEFIEQLPKGYQTEVGERGVGLSGGQKQRIAIARALLRRPKILIFDEATASLDPKTAEQIGKTINQLKGQVTVLFIAHQLPAGLLVDFGVRLGKVADELGPVAVERGEARQAS